MKTNHIGKHELVIGYMINRRTVSPAKKEDFLRNSEGEQLELILPAKSWIHRRLTLSDPPAPHTCPTCVAFKRECWSTPQ